MTLESEWDSLCFLAATLSDSFPIGESIRKEIVSEDTVHDRKKKRIKWEITYFTYRTLKSFRLSTIQCLYSQCVKPCFSVVFMAKQKSGVVKALNWPYSLSLGFFLPFSCLQTCWSLWNSISNELSDQKRDKLRQLFQEVILPVFGLQGVTINLAQTTYKIWKSPNQINCNTLFWATHFTIMYEHALSLQSRHVDRMLT